MPATVYGPEAFTVGADIVLPSYDSNWALTNPQTNEIYANAARDRLEMEGGAGGGNPCARWNGTVAANHRIVSDLTTGAANNSWPGHVVRCSSTFNGYLAEWDSFAGDIILYEVSSNGTVFDVLSQGGTVNQNTAYNGTYLEADGSSLEAGDDTNGAATVTATDATYSTGQPGLSLAGGAEVAANMSHDNVEIIDLDASGGTSVRYKYLILLGVS